MTGAAVDDQRSGLPAPFEDRPRTYARFGGWLYLFIIAAGLFAEVFVRESIVVPGDTLATAHRIAAAPNLWSLGAALEFAIVPCALALAVIEYLLLQRVHRAVALFAFSTNLVSIALEAANKTLLIAAGKLAMVDATAGGIGIDALAPPLGLVLRLHAVGFDVSLLVFGVVCLPLGWLIYHSAFLPRAIGVLMALAGFGYLVGTGSALFVPALARVVLPWVLAAPLIGEASFCLWLIFRGVDVAAWRARRAGPALLV